MKTLGGVLLGFVAGAVLVGTVTATAVPLACAPEREHAIEVMRFARYSHQHWIDDAGETDRWGFDRDWHEWWVASYDDVLGSLKDCRPADDYPALTDLPAEWEEYGYPARSAAGSADWRAP